MLRKSVAALLAALMLGGCFAMPMNAEGGVTVVYANRSETVGGTSEQEYANEAVKSDGASLYAASDAVSGTHGDNLTWTLDKSNGDLVISGMGEMGDYSSSDAPWDSLKDSIKAVKLPDSVTSIGDGAFADCTSMKRMVVPDSVTEIGAGAFTNCPELVIYGFKGSVIEKYASENGIKFVNLENANGDDAVDTVDYMDLVRNISAWSGYEDKIDALFADMNADGVVNATDLIILGRHIANWRGYERLPYLG